MFNHTGTRIYARKADSLSDMIALTAVFRDRAGQHVLKPTAFEDNPIPENYYVEPTFHLAWEQAQFLIDQLWDCGLRPTEGKGSAGALAATEAHLKDMQQISMQLLNHTLAGARQP